MTNQNILTPRNKVIDHLTSRGLNGYSFTRALMKYDGVMIGTAIEGIIKGDAKSDDEIVVVLPGEYIDTHPFEDWLRPQSIFGATIDYVVSSKGVRSIHYIYKVSGNSVRIIYSGFGYTVTPESILNSPGKHYSFDGTKFHLLDITKTLESKKEKTLRILKEATSYVCTDFCKDSDFMAYDISEAIRILCKKAISPYHRRRCIKSFRVETVDKETRYELCVFVKDNADFFEGAFEDQRCPYANWVNAVMMAFDFVPFTGYKDQDVKSWANATAKPFKPEDKNVKDSDIKHFNDLFESIETYDRETVFECINTIWPKHSFISCRPSFLQGLGLTFYCKALNFAIDYRGKERIQYNKYWHQSIEHFNENKASDIKKGQLCKENNVKLVCIQVPIEPLSEIELLKSKLEKSEKECKDLTGKLKESRNMVKELNKEIEYLPEFLGKIAETYVMIKEQKELYVSHFNKIWDGIDFTTKIKSEIDLGRYAYSSTLNLAFKIEKAEHHTFPNRVHNTLEEFVECTKKDLKVREVFKEAGIRLEIVKLN